MACRFALWALSALFVLSCSQESPSPTAPPAAAAAEEAGPWQTVEINGALYRRMAAKPTETSQADLLITIPIRYETTADGSIRLSDTVQIAGRTYTADCGHRRPIWWGRRCGKHAGDGHSADRPGADEHHRVMSFWFSPEYDDHTRGTRTISVLRVPRRMWLGIGSRGSTDVKGWLYNQDGIVIDEDDNSREVMAATSSYWV